MGQGEACLGLEEDIFRERRLSFEKWWQRGWGLAIQPPGHCTVFIFKTTKVQDVCTFLHFFFFSPRFLILFINILSWFSNGVTV